MKIRFIALLATLLCLGWQTLQAGYPEKYYDATSGKKKAELKAALHDIIRTASVLGYGSGAGKTWSGFYTTDRTDDNYCIDRYSPERRQFTSTTGAISGMNIEHSFAKSWWGGTQNQAYKDLYNLMPSDKEANSSKSNYAMGEVTDASYSNGSIKVGNGSKTSAKVWEPEDKWKGDFARTYMYMVTCYSDLTWTSEGLKQLDNNQWPTFNSWTMEMVLRWSREDPVDEIELARNEAVYEIQGNRNPFVDFPNLCEYVWGDSINYAFYPDHTSTGTDPDPDPNPDPDPQPGEDTELINEPMTATLGVFSDVLPDGTQGSLWKANSAYGAVANAFSSGKTADNYLLAEVDLKRCTDATLTFTHQTGFHSTHTVKDTYFQVLITDDYTGEPRFTNWKALDAKFPAAPTSSWSKATESGEISLKDYAGKIVCIAFRYTAEADACYGWEIRDVLLTGKVVPVGIDDAKDNGTQTRRRAYDLTGRPVNPDNARGLIIIDGKLHIR